MEAIISTAVVVFFTGIFTLLAKVYKFGPFLEEPPSSPEIPPSSPVPAPPPPVPVDRVKLCALAQQEFEGYYPGSPAYKNNNPGNLRSVQGPFLVFPTYEAGFEALEAYIRRVAQGNHHAYPKGGDTTIMEYTHIYTSDPEPSATNYAKHISAKVGLSTNTPMKALLA